MKHLLPDEKKKGQSNRRFYWKRKKRRKGLSTFSSFLFLSVLLLKPSIKTDKRLKESVQIIATELAVAATAVVAVTSSPASASASSSSSAAAAGAVPTLSTLIKSKHDNLTLLYRRTTAKNKTKKTRRFTPVPPNGSLCGRFRSCRSSVVFFHDQRPSIVYPSIHFVFVIAKWLPLTDHCLQLQSLTSITLIFFPSFCSFNLSQFILSILSLKKIFLIFQNKVIFSSG